MQMLNFSDIVDFFIEKTPTNPSLWSEVLLNLIEISISIIQKHIIILPMTTHKSSGLAQVGAATDVPSFLVGI